MVIRFSKRINLGNGAGLNVSKSGVSSSVRGKYGSIGSKGFTLKTGIPGLSYRGSWGSRSMKGDAALIGLVVYLVIAALGLGLVIAWNLIRFFGWLCLETYHFILRQIEKRNNKEVNT